MEKFVVDLTEHSCSSYLWDLVGILCRHAMAAIHDKIEIPKDYVHPYYKKNAYLACYGPKITPINGQKMWPKSDFPELLWPIYKRPLGRPKKLRRREADEHVSHSKITKKNIAMKCTRCNQFGHNIRTCRKRNTTITTRKVTFNSIFCLYFGIQYSK